MALYRKEAHEFLVANNSVASTALSKKTFLDLYGVIDLTAQEIDEVFTETEEDRLGRCHEDENTNQLRISDFLKKQAADGSSVQPTT